MPTDSQSPRALMDLAAHFERLKATAMQLKQQTAARQRGYFTPEEDERTRRLLVSYRQGRAALFDIVLSCHDRLERGGMDERQTAQVFLTGFAAAVLLVDAGRFLRHTFGDSPVVRAKLNEPEPYFHIPPGTYDEVLKSLTDPMNAWRMYEATKYYDEHRSSLHAATANDAMLRQVASVIDRHIDRVRVSPTRYAQARLQVRVRQAADALLRRGLGACAYALQQAACCLIADLYVKPYHHPHVPAEIARQVRPLLRPGDVFITRKEHALTNYFLPGYWPHAALYLGDLDAMRRLGLDRHPNMLDRWRRLVSLDEADPHRVIEAMKDGVWLRTLASPMSVDAFVVIRPRLNDADIAAAIGRGLFHEGKGYDFDFDFSRSDRLVCTEVVYRSYDGVGDIRLDLTMRAGRPTLAAEDLLRLAMVRRCFEPVAAYCPSIDPHLLTGEPADAALRATVRSAQ